MISYMNSKNRWKIIIYVINIIYITGCVAKLAKAPDIQAVLIGF